MTATLVAALFGHPVAHSRSPEIHAAFARQTGIGLDYRAIDTRPGSLAVALAAFRRTGGSAANLTVPLKREGLACCTELDDPARLAGAINTLSWHETGWLGLNTDGTGLLADLGRLGLDPAGRRILIIGAGGATAGILGPLLAQGPAGVFIANRSSDAARSLARACGSARVAGGSLKAPDTLEPFDLVIQATSLGHQGTSPKLAPGWLAPRAVAYDLNYGPAHLPFAAECARHGLDCHDGLGMLVCQAAASFQIWTGRQPGVQAVIEEQGKSLEP